MEKAKLEATDKSEKWAKLKAELKARNAQCNDLRETDAMREAGKRQLTLALTRNPNPEPRPEPEP